MKNWREWLPDWVWRAYELVSIPQPWQGRATVPDQVSSEEVGEVGPTDWRGTPIRVGYRVVYPCEAYGRSTQMAEGTVVALRESGATIEVERRSRTGRPNNAKYSRPRVRLTAVGLANVTVLE